MGRTFKIVGIGGTTRPGSTSELLLAAILARCEKMGGKVQMFGGTELASLPHYAPETPTRSRAQSELVQAVRGADGLVVSTPGYHGGISALVKNALDLLEDTRNDARCYLSGCPVGLVVSAAGWQATGTVLSSLRDIVSALRGWSTPIGVAINSLEQRPFDANGALIDDAVASLIAAQAEQIMSLCNLASIDNHER